ncbi:MAG: dTDP-4-dehydrorhamnose reductase [Bacteroidetes bacterium RBG_13_43_22]|nr:MAG: dTDP-4-dehydrorhamnose reductase [Bacteroidetes bacterium RBG_13_43_22]
MAVILVTGANGQLGNELWTASKNYYGYDFVFTDIDTLDISSPGKTAEFVKQAAPDWIINCAAYNFVDKAESEPDKALLINGVSVRNISEAIKGSETRFIHISSDYVFDGFASVPYNEDSATNPLGAYGRSKLEGEKAALLHNGTMIIRTSWLYSSFGENFVKTIIRKGKEKGLLKVVFDQIGSPTSAADLASAIMQIVSGVIRNQTAFNAGIYHYSNEGVCSWYDFATEIIKEAGLDCRVLPVLSAEYPSAVKRPSYSVLDKTKIKETYNIEIQHWRASLKKCIKLII